ncbi:hypothetical protein K435DRAFT_413463 [Dendrothele bispora CBS 962.96]|uniref:Uncharacterized protein n=1 Tax=Dendrothele bispora (strain CBS 962.96) TaxID=1314807 RepID=A0A4S8L5Z4_DENBC|nr:hypothetical protein K435DRAFT_413463 [Dendrothele bispora CBS 962.96]
MSASGFLGRAESPPFVSGGVKPSGIRPLPSLPSTPAFPEYVPRSVESTSPNTASPNDKDKSGQDQDDTVKLGVHPRIEADLEDEELSGFSSDGTLSSPVFAHSDSDSDVGSMRRGYGYGFHNERKKKTKEERDGEGRRVSVGVGAGDEGRDSERDRGRWNPTVHDGEGDSVTGEADSSYVHVDHPSGTREQGRATPRAHSSRSKNRVKSREKESTGEWIVLDLQDDHGALRSLYLLLRSLIRVYFLAFGSFLRVLHRYAPHALSSTFWSQLSSFVPPPQAPAPAAPTPATPTPTPVAGSTSFPDGHKVEGSDFLLVERLRRVPENPENISESGSIPSSRHQFDGMSSVPTTATFSSEQSTSLLAHHRSLPSLSIPSSKPDFHHPSPLQALRSKRSHSNSGLGDTYDTLGVLPYPEWRTEVVTRAQRAGMGALTRAMEWFLFQDGNLGISSSVLGFNPQGFFSANKANRVGPTLFMGEDNNPEANLLRGKRKRGRKMTIEQENIAMGIGTDSPIDGESIHTVEKDVQSLDVESEYTDSGEESSDTEWMGWMADLHRQAQVMKEAETKKQLVEEDLDEYMSDCNPQNDHRRYQEKQKLLEPSATVIVTAPNQHGHQRSATPPNPGQTSRSQFPAMPITPQVLTSPSSNESLNLSGRSRGRKLSFGLSTADQPSPPSTIGRLERSNSRSRIQTQHQRQPSNSRTPNLLHFASTGLIGGPSQIAREKEFPSGLATSATRRPSMPALSSTSQAQAQSMTSTSHASSPLNPQYSLQQQQQTPIGLGTATSHRSASQTKALLAPASPGVENSFGLESSSSRLPGSIPRRSSTVGLPLALNPSSGSSISLGRSGSMLAKAPALLRKKDTDSDKVKHKGKGKKEKEPETLADDSKSSRKPRLSLSTGNSVSQQNLAEIQTATARTQSPPPPLVSPTSTSFVSRHVRRVRSGSSLVSGSEGAPEPKPGNQNPKNNPPVKRNKTFMRGVASKAERIISGLEATLDFVDARQ